MSEQTCGSYNGVLMGTTEASRLAFWLTKFDAGPPLHRKHSPGKSQSCVAKHHASLSSSTSRIVDVPLCFVSCSVHFPMHPGAQKWHSSAVQEVFAQT